MVSETDYSKMNPRAIDYITAKIYGLEERDLQTGRGTHTIKPFWFKDDIAFCSVEDWSPTYIHSNQCETYLYTLLSEQVGMNQTLRIINSHQDDLFNSIIVFQAEPYIKKITKCGFEVSETGSIKKGEMNLAKTITALKAWDQFQGMKF